MTFKKYNTANNAICSLDLPITNSSNIIIAKGNFNRFPTSNFIIKITQYNGSVVIGRENILISTRSGSIFNVLQRAVEPVPIDDNASSNIQQALPFEADSIIELVISSATITDIQDEVSRLENDKLNKSTYNAEKIAYASTSTGNDDYAITVPDITTYTERNGFKVKADVGNTGTATLNVNGLGAKTLKKLKDSAFVDLETGDIIPTQIFRVTYNSSNGGFFQFSVDPATVTIPDVTSTKSTFIAGENITAGNALYIQANGKVYKTDAANAGKINFIGFASANALIGNTVTVDTSGVSNTQSGLTVGSDYYLGDGISGSVSNSSTIQQLNGDTNGQPIGHSTSLISIIQSITLLTDRIVRSITCKFWKTGTPTDNIYIEIYSDIGRTKLLGTSNSVASSSITSGGTATFTFSDILLKSNTQYFFNFKRSGSLNSSNYLSLGQGGDIYSGGTAYREISTNNFQDQGTDVYFNIQMGTATILPLTTNPIAENFVRRIGKSVSITAIELETSANNSLEGTTSTTATTGSVTLGNAVGYITVKINGVDRKIPYYS